MGPMTIGVGVGVGVGEGDRAGREGTFHVVVARGCGVAAEGGIREGCRARGVERGPAPEGGAGGAVASWSAGSAGIAGVAIPAGPPNPSDPREHWFMRDEVGGAGLARARGGSLFRRQGQNTGCAVVDPAPVGVSAIASIAAIAPVNVDEECPAAARAAGSSLRHVAGEIHSGRR